MKKVTFLILFLGAILLIPVASYAIFDAGIYGGYSFAGDIKTALNKPDPKGFEYGIISHVNGTVIENVLSLGIGAYYQRSPLSYQLFGYKKNYNKDTIGLDAFAQLELPIIIHPFVRASTAIWDNVKGGWQVSSTDYFKSYSLGGGVAFKFLMFQLYGEYLFTIGSQKGNDIKGHTAHVGFRVSI